MTTRRRDRYARRFSRRSRRSRSQDLAKQAKITVSASDTSKRARALLARWERTPNQLDIRGIDTRRGRRRSVRPSRPSARPKRTTRATPRPPRRPTTRRRRVRRPSEAIVTPPPVAPKALPPGRAPRVSPRSGMTFTPVAGVPKPTVSLVEEVMKIAAKGGTMPKSLRQRIKGDPYLSQREIELGVLRPRRTVNPWSFEDRTLPRSAPAQSGIVVRGPDGEVIKDWGKMTAAQRKELVRRSASLRPRRIKGTAARRLKAEVWREFRRLRPGLTRDAYRKAQAAMRAVVGKYSDEGPKTVPDEAFQQVKQQVKSEFAEEMKRRHPDWGPAWGRRRGTL